MNEKALIDMFAGKLNEHDVRKLKREARRMVVGSDLRPGDMLRVPVFGELPPAGFELEMPNNVTPAVLRLVVWRNPSVAGNRDLFAVVLEFAGKRVFIEWTDGVGGPPPDPSIGAGPMMGSGVFVRKTKGYRFDGVVRAFFQTTTGEDRVVVENGDGMLHIFNVGQLEADPTAAERFNARRSEGST